MTQYLFNHSLHQFSPYLLNEVPCLFIQLCNFLVVGIVDGLCLCSKQWRFLEHETVTAPAPVNESREVEVKEKKFFWFY